MDELFDDYIELFSSRDLTEEELVALKDSIILRITDHYEPKGEEETGEEIGFWKRLAKNDVSKNSPGQIIIPLKYEEFFPDLIEDETRVGSGQLSKIFDIHFHTISNGKNRKFLRSKIFEIRDLNVFH